MEGAPQTRVERATPWVTKPSGTEVTVRSRLRTVWRASAYLMLGAAVGVLAWFLVAGLLVVMALALVLVGLPLLPEAVLVLRRFASLERWRAGRVLGVPIAERYTPLTGTLRERLRGVVSHSATYRDAVWLLVQAFVGLFVGLIVVAYWLAIPILLSVPFWWWAVSADEAYNVVTLLPWPTAPEGQGLLVNNILIDSWPRALLVPPLLAAAAAAVLALVTPWLARSYARLARWVLSPSARTRLVERVEELTETRAGALDAHAAELRRIERDLHDGTQARLVTVAMRLGLAEKGVTKDPDKAVRLLREALEGTEEAMAELRQVVRSIYPPILSDRGLDGAVSALAAAAPVPVTAEVDPGGRLPAAVEAAVYFVIAEALANIAKHAQASHAWVRVHRQDDTLNVTVRDDGRGGADEQAGTGLAGIQRRVAASDGTYRLSSPPGGPTELTVELPCGS
jgi:signal transduction histidine kinase